MRPILVVGDWIVDEHWVVGSDRSTTASRRGEEHYHALENVSRSVEALCGAGTVASLLHVAVRSGKRLFEVHGVGSWHPKDQDVLQAMMGRDGLDGQNRYRVTRPIQRPDTGDLQLHSVHTMAGDAAGGDVATTRVIRVYVDDKKKGLTHKYRLDWEKPPKRTKGSRKPSWISTSEEADAWWNAHSQLRLLQPQAIIIKDLVKGVVSEALISKLIHEYRSQHPRWYVSSKEWHLQQTADQKGWQLSDGSWLSQLKRERQDVRLVFVPQVAASAAISLRSINSWRTPSLAPSWHAMQLMDALSEEVRGVQSKPDVAVLPEGSHLFLRTGVDNKADAALLTSHELSEHREDIVPVSSVLFAALVAMMESESSPRKAAEVLAEAVEFTAEWMKTELSRFTSSEKKEWKPSNHTPINTSAKSSVSLERHSWSDLLEDWRAARRNLGILSRRDPGPGRLARDENTIELWRAMTDVDGYICLIPSKREAVRAIKRELVGFTRQKVKTNHVSMLLESEPGSGKTFLLDKLAQELGMELVQFNITRMTTLNDLLDCFDELVSRQSSTPATRPLLVFFDEINAQLGSSQVYGTFLDPIDRGTYTRGGRAFYIRPCAWVFAGTGMGEVSPEKKGSDFRSRLTLPPLKFWSEVNDRMAALERVYIGANSLIDQFPDVTHVSNLVLEAFRLLPPHSSLRDQNRFVARFQNVRSSYVWAGSVPEAFIEQTWQEAHEKVQAVHSTQRRQALREFKEARKEWASATKTWRAKSRETEKPIRIEARRVLLEDR